MSVPSKEALMAAHKMDLSCNDCILTEHDNNVECDDCQELWSNTARACDAFAAAAVQAEREACAKIAAETEAKFARFLRWECGKDKVALWQDEDGTEEWSKP